MVRRALPEDHGAERERCASTDVGATGIGTGHADRLDGELRVQQRGRNDCGREHPKLALSSIFRLFFKTLDGSKITDVERQNSGWEKPGHL